MSSHSSNVFNRVGSLKPRRSKFDLSYRNNFTCKMGQLIPVMCDEAVPGDYFKIGNELLIRFQPLAAPIMHEISATVHYFFVPYRLLWDKWEEFIVQGDTPPLPLSIPKCVVTPSNLLKGTPWDYFGMPFFDGVVPGSVVAQSCPIAFPFLAYNKIWNEYYRDENLQDEVRDTIITSESSIFPIVDSEIEIRYRNWKKDYFTAALPFRQKGQSPALPVNIVGNDYAGDTASYFARTTFRNSLSPNVNFTSPAVNSSTITSTGTTTELFATQVGGTGSDRSMALGVLGHDIASTIRASTFNVSDLRLSFQIQKWLERNARAGTRYTSFLQSHFGVSPNDSRLDRPEYIGGTKQPVIISEVLQTSQTTEGSNGSPLAQMGGHGLGADAQYAGSYNVQEFGLIMGLLSIMPKPSYQQGMNRQWLRSVPTDFYFPEFSHLSEQAIVRREIFTNFTSGDNQIFGYTGQYDEMRVKHDIVSGEMRVKRIGGSAPWTTEDQLSFWNMTRLFSTAPNLNSAFISTKNTIPEDRVFAVTGVDTMIVNCLNKIHAIRPMPLIAEPGLVDHF